MRPFMPLTAAPFAMCEGGCERSPRTGQLRPLAAGCARQSRPSGHRCAASARADPPVFPGWTPVIDFPVLPSTPAAFQRSRCSLGALCAPRQGPLPPARAVDVRRPPAWAEAFAWAKVQTPLPRRCRLRGAGALPPTVLPGPGSPCGRHSPTRYERRLPRLLAEGSEGLGWTPAPGLRRSPAWPRHRPPGLLK